MKRLFAALLVLILPLLLLARPLALPLSAQDESTDLLTRINNLRASLGLSAYALNGALGAAASDQAQWMLSTGNVSHSRPDGSNPRSRAAAFGYSSDWVSENIYMGTNATVDAAWNFWINSAVHYAGLTSRNYSEIGIGIAHGENGAAYVLVFGNPGGSWDPPASSASGSAGAGGGAAQVQRSGPPPYVLGQDVHGNIMHSIQPGDTPGGIALLYGYTWEAVPTLMALNGQTDNRSLEIGAVFLVPPRDGTWTPTPTPEGTPYYTPTPAPASPTGQDSAGQDSAAETSEQPTIVQPTIMQPTLTPTLSPTPPESPRIATVGYNPAAGAAVSVNSGTAVPGVQVIAAATFTPLPGSPTPAAVAMLAEPYSADANAPSAAPPGASGTHPLLVAVIVLQAGIVLAAGAEFFRRARRERSGR